MTSGNDNLYLGDLWKRVFLTGVILGVACLGISVAMASSVGLNTFYKSWLVGFMVILGISLGGLFFTVVHHLTRAGWSVLVRRVAEGLMANLRWIWVLFLPILILVLMGHGDVLYQWADHAAVEGDELLEKKVGYLNVSFWSIRAVIFIVIWIVLASFFFKNSVAQDADGDISRTHKMQRWAPIAIILYAVTQTFASIDWIMSLQPKWFSTMFGVYFFAASLTGFFSVLIILLWRLQSKGRITQSVTREHFQDLGKWLFAFGVVFWAYIGYSQYMLIWYANLPVETAWFLTRQTGGWQYISLLLLFGHFALPFVLLVSRWPKRWKSVLAIVAAWMLLMFCVDIYWLVIPSVPEDAIHNAISYPELVEEIAAGTVSVGYGWHLINFTCVAGMLSLLVAGTAFNLRKCALVPLSDPRLSESMTFENM
jgi:hypothetical protein